MSDTIETEAAPPQPPPGYSMVQRTKNINGRDVDYMAIAFGMPPRSVEVKVLDLGDQFDLAEIGGDQVNNALWLSMAIAAASVLMLDGTPAIGKLTKDRLRETLRKLGRDGLAAVTYALLPANDAPAGEEVAKAVAGNSVGTAVSASASHS